ncbi:18904_t:CDS:2, partial [Racocetra fulgida]
NFSADQEQLHQNHTLAINGTLQEIASMLTESGRCIYNIVKENDEIINDHPTATPDYLVQLTHPGIPNHEIQLKTGAICSIMRNISIHKGLVKNACVIIKKPRTVLN